MASARSYAFCSKHTRASHVPTIPPFTLDILSTRYVHSVYLLDLYIRPLTTAAAPQRSVAPGEHPRRTISARTTLTLGVDRHPEYATGSTAAHPTTNHLRHVRDCHRDNHTIRFATPNRVSPNRRPRQFLTYPHRKSWTCSPSCPSSESFVPYNLPVPADLSFHETDREREKKCLQGEMAFLDVDCTMRQASGSAGAVVWCSKSDCSSYLF